MRGSLQLFLPEIDPHDLEALAETGLENPCLSLGDIFLLVSLVFGHLLICFNDFFFFFWRGEGD